MTGRFALALSGALSTLGCADMLGLGGLTFDQQASGGSVAVSSGGSQAAGGTGGTGGSGSGGIPSGGGGTLTLGSGGQPEPPPKLTSDYPTILSPEGVLVATWAGFQTDGSTDNGTFWLYVPETGALLPHRLDLLLPDSLGTVEVPADWDMLYAPTLHEATWLFGYDAATGLVDYGPAPTAEEAFVPDTRAGSPGWTHVLLVGDAHAPFLVAADRTTGIVRIGPADPTLEDPDVTSAVWDADFTELVAFRRGDVDGVLRLDSELGVADFVPIEGGVLGEPASLEVPLAPGWTLAASYSSRWGAGFLLYWAGAGDVTAYFPDGQGVLQSEDALWSRGVTEVVSVHGEGAPWAVTYNSETGVTDLHQLDPLRDQVVVK